MTHIMTFDEQAAMDRAKKIIDTLSKEDDRSIVAWYDKEDADMLQTLLNMIEKRNKDIEYLVNGLRTYEKRFGVIENVDRCRLCGGEHPAVYCKICYDKVVSERDKAERMERSYKEREQAILDVLGVDY